MGVQISQVRSVTLDKWSEESVKSIEQMGNAKANKVWEARIVSPFRKIQPNEAPVEREKFIIAKYQKKLFKDDHENH